MEAKKGRKVKLAWGITGAGDLLPDTFDVMKELAESGEVEITAVMSRAAVKVVNIYRLREMLDKIAHKIMIEEDANTPFVVGALQTGKYDALLVAPATGNTVAKIVRAIADSLITNAVAMTNKTDTEVFVLPVEKENKEVNTKLPDGSFLKLKTRAVDALNTTRLRNMEGITVLETPGEIRDVAGRIAS